MSNDWKVAAIGFGAGLLGAVVGVATLGAAPKTVKPTKFSVLETNELRLVEKDGAVRGKWRIDDDGQATLTLFSRKDTPSMVIVAPPDGGGAIGIGNGSSTALVSVLKEVPEVQLKGDNGVVVARVPLEGAPVIKTLDDEKEVLFSTPK